MENIEDLLLKALALPAKIHSDCDIKIRALRKAIIKSIIRYDESTNPKSKDLLEEYDMSISETVAVTSVNMHCHCIDQETMRILEYNMQGVYLLLDESGLSIGISPLCEFENDDERDLCHDDVNLVLNDYEQIAHALLDKIYETQAK